MFHRYRLCSSDFAEGQAELLVRGDIGLAQNISGSARMATGHGVGRYPLMFRSYC